MNREYLLVVDDEQSIRSQLKWAFADAYDVLLASTQEEAYELVKAHSVAVVLLDLGLVPHEAENISGLDVLISLRSENPMIKVIIVTGNNVEANALKAISLGAFDFYSKPIEIDELKTIVKRAFHLYKLERKALDEQPSPAQIDQFQGIVGRSEKIKRVFDLIRRVAPSDISVLITGESGVGKELVSSAIHNCSKRKAHPFVAINCAAIPENLLESELFGHEKGAFTGALKMKVGKFEQANQGTVFLDEIGEMDFAMQAKLLRFLQTHEIERVGGNRTLSLDLRIVAATNRDLLEEVAEGRFREDLYYRLAGVVLKIPPLRERIEDVLLLANHFLKVMSQKTGDKVKKLSGEAEKLLLAYHWPGNIRQLENTIQKSIVMGRSDVIGAEDLWELNQEGNTDSGVKPLKTVKEELERDYISQALQRNQWVISRAAQELGVSRVSLYDFIKKYDLKKQ